MIETGFPTGGPTLGELGEREVIALIRAQAPSALNGDDAAVLTQAAPNSRVVASTDMLVQGRHFTAETTTPYLLGRKAALQNFADIEAMHTYEGTETVQGLIIGRDITGIGAFA